MSIVRCQKCGELRALVGTVKKRLFICKECEIKSNSAKGKVRNKDGD